MKNKIKAMKVRRKTRREKKRRECASDVEVWNILSRIVWLHKTNKEMVRMAEITVVQMNKTLLGW